ncbi:oxygen tolerance protein BatD [Arcticibacter tournemirensis]|uniref:Protein BatD n=1 Tax=Arcticibacter tournemirensis TaxID=699437 RepID=A0A5M9H9F4_9SPHI|nr:BatD family protein [Arcticibacter tournemirensis]KAA8481838.1 protein BatD [Arcticibacter tournemirensis]TQM50124.1 oxygen tolerance protein BatD [Arcticibacter tournemirensis]
MTLRHYILLFALFFTNWLYAQNTRFSASASKSEVATGEEFEVTFSVNANGDRFSPPEFNGFQVLGGPNMSSSMTSINGSMTVSTSYSYYLMAVKEGTFTFGAASISVNGKTYKTNPLRIRVVKGRPVPQGSSRPAPAVPQEDFEESQPEKLSNSLFLRAVTDKNNVYQGQQLTLSFKLYTRVSIVESQVDKIPDLNGFWSEDIKNTNQNVEWKEETYKGKQYHVAVVKQTILFPEHSGNLRIDPVEMTFIVRQKAPARTLMDEFFGTYEDVKYKVKSPPLTVRVKPLPTAGKPQGFTGAVGQFKAEASLDKKELKANEALNYTLKISGSGNLKLIKEPVINFPADFEKYDPKITDAITMNTSGASGSRSYNYLLIPRHEGDFAIEPVRFSYFNPASGRYETASVQGFEIKVNKGNPSENVVYSGAGKQDVKLLNKDISYIKTAEPDLYKEGKEFHGSVWYYLLLLTGPLIFAGALLYRQWDKKNNSDPLKVKSRKAGKIAARHLANAQKQLSENNSKVFYEEVFKGLYGYLSDKLNIPAANLNKESIAAELQAKALDDRLIRQLLETLDLCEMARFAPVTGISANEVFEKAKNIIYEIEDKL